MSFSIGQRWVSQAELDLGLGTVIGADNRFVQVLFPGAEETRQYAMDQAPLMRVEFAPGDKIQSLEDYEFIVEDVEVMSNTFVYHGRRVDNDEAVSVKEIMLDHHVKLNNPEARLFTGAYDRKHWFSLRLEAHQKKAELQTFSLHGLLGARVSLIPHQLYIADTVGKRFAPRVLLSDEVGLGKTIEAGLIIHQQLVSGRASRVLVALPASLQHQWLVEMLRRFNLKFAIFDDQRCEAEAESDPEKNVFENEQLVFVNHEWLSKQGKWQQKLTETQWDLVVVDEAHHVTPPEQGAEPQSVTLFEHVQALGQATKGLILLTATPDQLGHYGHFSRLNLLDPNRFHDYDAYKAEELAYQDIADIANLLINNETLDAAHLETLSVMLNDEESLAEINLYQAADDKAEHAESLINSLLDRHGTGRIMFRNSRQGIKGFPERKVFAYPQERPEGFAPNVDTLGLHPELQHKPQTSDHKPWWQVDPRVEWLCQFLKENKEEKVLVICANANTAMQLDDALFEQEGLRSTVFHEGMTIVERDKAAAYFADEENSAQALVCSEIGSEGRNFQFAHHLVLFDLPANPDLLEQRIGRLDRIGQTETVQIHVPYLEESSQEVLFELYQNSFDAFEKTSTTARVVFEQNSDAILHQLEQPDDAIELATLIEQCKEQNDALKAEVEKGRDRLLEINSSGGSKAQAICEKIEEIDDSTELMAFMTQVWDHFGVNNEEKSSYSYILKPGDHMMTEHFPSLMADGMTVCFDRDTALSHEDQHFLSWEHPMTTGVLDMLTASDLGNTSVCLLKNKKLPAGTYFLEVNFLVTTNAPRHLQLHRYMPNTPIRMMLDKSGNDLASKVKQGSLDGSLKNVKKTMATQLIKALKDEVSTLIEKANANVGEQVTAVTEKAKAALIEDRQQELSRLQALQAVNPSIRDEEIEFLKTQLEQCVNEIDAAQVQLDALRLIVVDHS